VISVTAITVKLAVGGTVAQKVNLPLEVLQPLVGVVIGGIGLAAEAVFAKPISQRGAAMIPQAQSPHVHVLERSSSTVVIDAAGATRARASAHIVGIH
jgi:hypothetical protein